MLGLGLFESIDFAVVAELGHRPSSSACSFSVQGGGSILGGLVVACRDAPAGVKAPWSALAFVGFAVVGERARRRFDRVVLGSVVVLGAAVSWFAVGLGTAMQRLTPAGCKAG